MIRNTTRLPHAAFRKLAPGGLVLDVFVLKASLDLDPCCADLKAATKQVPVCMGDRHAGGEAAHPAALVLAEPADAVLFKPGADIWVTGTARSHDHRPLRRWAAGIGVGEVRHLVELYGPRRWTRGLMGWGLRAPEPTDAVALDYRLAFGGHWEHRHPDATQRAEASKPDNPAGCGWLPDGSALAALPAPARRSLQAQLDAVQQMSAPQVLLPGQSLLHPSQDLPTAGLGPIARWWSPRAAFLGTRDAHWRSTRFPHYPDDFDLRFLQAAVAPLRAPQALRGDERVGLMALLPEGDCGWQLPGLKPSLRARLDDAREIQAPMRLDTLSVNLDTRQLCLSWRTVFPPAHTPREITVELDPGVLQRIGLPT